MRGQHANRKSEFVLINVAGKSKVKIKDGEGNEIIFCLNRPHTGLYIPTMVWKIEKKTAHEYVNTHIREQFYCC